MSWQARTFVIGAVLAGAVLSGCNTGSSSSDLVVIRTASDAVERQKQLRDLTEETLIRYVKREPLTQKDIDNLNTAEPIARGMIAYDSQRYTNHLVLGQILLALGKRDDALSSMLQCIMLAPPPEQRTQDDQFIVAETLNDIGNIYYGMNQFDEAESAVRRAIEINPANLKYLSNLAQILISVRRFEEAKVVLERMRKVNPKSEALAALEKLVQEKPAVDAKKP